MKSNLKNVFNYTLIKISLIPLNLWIISSLIFILLRIAPGDPIDAILGSGADLEARELMRHSYEIKNGTGIMRYPLKYKSIWIKNWKKIYSKHFNLKTIRYIF